MTRQIIMSGGRNVGKSRKMALMIEKTLDKNPDAVVILANADGSIEKFENAEFEDVTVKQLK